MTWPHCNAAPTRPNTGPVTAPESSAISSTPPPTLPTLRTGHRIHIDPHGQHDPHSPLSCVISRPACFPQFGYTAPATWQPRLFASIPSSLARCTMVLDLIISHALHLETPIHNHALGRRLHSAHYEQGSTPAFTPLVLTPVWTLKSGASSLTMWLFSMCYIRLFCLYGPNVTLDNGLIRSTIHLDFALDLVYRILLPPNVQISWILVTVDSTPFQAQYRVGNPATWSTKS
ncbi:hypothetical protein CTheo_1412 [Ceratobasidium theobromae]|uniref:Uncharacterized protein n=1 Tax=Ceratobasidium theobromae TaxID=1582974 RepID=A0A5N5QTW6_9AGAM|nr:hypothetical protein CTheo_1412 [Ceratobasidium theobromae]